LPQDGVGDMEKTSMQIGRGIAIGAAITRDF
jgi:hypothetical protein